MEIRHIAEFMANEAKNEFLGGFFMENISEQMSGDACIPGFRKILGPPIWAGHGPQEGRKGEFSEL